MKCLVSLSMILLLLPLVSLAQQKTILDFHYDANNHQTRLLDDSNIINGVVCREVVGGNNQGVVWLNRLEAGKDGYAEFVIDQFDVGINISLCLVDEALPFVTRFVIELNNGNVRVLENGTYHAVGSYENGNVFKIERQQDKILYYKDGVPYTYEPTVSTNVSLAAKVEVISALPNTNSQLPRLDMSFPIEVNKRDFVQLKKELDGHYIFLDNNKLRFIYEQEYELVAGMNNDQLQYEIYDWNRTVLQDDTQVALSKRFGTNYFELEIQAGNGFSNDQYYTLEVVGNKEEKYFLRFKY